jgi:hypothetical protein
VTYAFTDGLTLVESTVHNDLVTGTEVAHVEMNTAAGSVFALDDAGAGTLAAAAGLDITAVNNLLLKSTTGNLTVQANAAAKLVHVLGALVTVESDGGNLHLISAGNTYLDSGNVNAFTSVAKTTIQATDAGAGDIELDAGRDLLVNAIRDEVHAVARDENHTVGRNFSLSVAGASGASIFTTIGNLNLDAGTVDDTAETRIMPRSGAPAATLKLRFWNGAGAGQQDGNISPAGGGTVDAECRTAVDTILGYLYAWGLVTNPVP